MSPSAGHGETPSCGGIVFTKCLLDLARLAPDRQGGEDRPGTLSCIYKQGSDSP